MKKRPMTPELKFALSEFERARLSVEQNSHVVLHEVDMLGCYKIVLRAVRDAYEEEQ